MTHKLSTQPKHSHLKHILPGRKSIVFQKKHQSGFTMIELLMYLGLYSILIVVITQLFLTLIESRTEAENLTRLQQESRYIAQRLSYDIRRAESVTLPAQVGQSGNQLQLNIDGETFRYQVNVNGFLELVSPSGTASISSQVTADEFLVQKTGSIGLNDGASVRLLLVSPQETAQGQDEQLSQFAASTRWEELTRCRHAGLTSEAPSSWTCFRIPLVKSIIVKTKNQLVTYVPNQL